jgi:hypothetical protein
VQIVHGSRAPCSPPGRCVRSGSTTRAVLTRSGADPQRPSSTGSRSPSPLLGTWTGKKIVNHVSERIFVITVEVGLLRRRAAVPDRDA